MWAHPRIERGSRILYSSDYAHLAKSLLVHWAHAAFAVMVITIVVVNGSSSSFSPLLQLSLWAEFLPSFCRALQ
jgi:hypothetical protein